MGILIGTSIGYFVSKNMERDEALNVGVVIVLSAIFWPIAIFFVFCLLVGAIFISLFGRDY